MAYINGNSILFSPRVNVTGGGLRTYTDVETYVRLDIVSYNGSLYTPIVDEVSSVEPTNTEYWEEIIDAKVDKEYVEALETRIEKDNQTTKTEIANLEKEHEMFDKRIANVESATLAFTEDSSSAYEKLVPANSAKYALVNKVGGMTYKCNNLFNEKFFEQSDCVSKVVYNGENCYKFMPTSVQAVGIIPLDIKAGEAFACRFEISAPNGADIYFNFKLADGTSAYLYEASGVVDNFVVCDKQFTFDKDVVGIDITTYSYNIADTYYIKDYMINKGVLLPYKPFFEGLRDTKVTKLVSEGANLFNAHELDTDNRFSVNEDGSKILLERVTNGNGYIYPKTKKLSDFCPMLREGDTVYIKFETENPSASISAVYLADLEELWFTKNARTITKEDLNSLMGFYGNNYMNGYTEPVTLLNFRVVRDVNTPFKPYRSSIDTFSISAELRAFLEDKGYGYGKGIEGYPNYIDFEGKVFAQNAEEFVFKGDEKWSKNAEAGDYWSFYITKSEYPWLKFSDKYADTVHLCNIAKSQWWDVNASEESEFAWWSKSSAGIRVHKSRLPNYENLTDDNSKLNAFKAWLKSEYDSGNPVIFIWALAEPAEPIDISQYLTDDNFIEVEGGGIVRAVNEYEQDAPTTISYVSAIGG